jgi:hypothetical protein
MCTYAFYYLGILAALAYFMSKLNIHISFVPNNYLERDALSSALLLSAACLPVVGVTVDQFRKAQRFGHFARRLWAASRELEQLASELQMVDSAMGKLKGLHTVEKFFHEQSKENLISEIDALFSE